MKKEFAIYLREQKPKKDWQILTHPQTNNERENSQTIKLSIEK